jgi:RNA polymerase sigma-70 factor (ECF subfamily)
MMNKQFLDLYNHYKDKVYTMAYRLCGSRDRALDVAQDIFIKVFEKRRKLTTLENLDAYIFRMTRNRCIDIIRKEKRFEPLPDNENRLAQYEDRAEQADEVDFLLTPLNPDQRVCVILIELLGMSYEETARICETDPGTVKSRMHRAKEKMREHYLRREKHESGQPN